ncbi:MULTISPECIES: histidine phosphatase family protein [Bacillaceae]|uniref:Histidine phosphatase family protein n=1 Tax=Evansella alkalicola TaxID=745819 RepID=A0ABS6JWX5_9BACI|nr:MULTISPECIES: histidine phosphatase family protein [Bacillaceae]MBU9722890.1 histidine phosphatase family protein [Bacillus alkalicola]
MNIFFIRHGQSEANLNGIIQGQSDYPLSNLGKKQAMLVGEYFSNIPLDTIYSSDLSRAYETAEAVAGAQGHSVKSEAVAEAQGHSVKTLTVLREVGLGPLEGVSRAELMSRYPLLKNNSILTTGIEGTETLESITDRCKKVEQLLLQEANESNIGVVSHGGFISIFLMYLIAGDKWHDLNRPFVIGNTGITKVELSQTGRSKFHYINRTSHLDDSRHERVEKAT